MTVGTVEEKIVALQARKRELVEGLLDEERRESLKLSAEEPGCPVRATAVSLKEATESVVGLTSRRADQFPSGRGQGWGSC